ncbi:MAG: DUF4160 domain-containing protein [Magnetococcus sp. MYC-9]
MSMPTLYEYFGLIVLFYAGEHEPIHVHGSSQGRVSRAEIIVLDGVISEVRYSTMPGRQQLKGKEMRYFRELVTARAHDIVIKWTDFFVFHKLITPERITRRLK